MEVTARLENWYALNYQAGITKISGEIYDDVHERWENGTEVLTSSVLSSVDAITEGSIVTTRNSTYLLGKKA